MSTAPEQVGRGLRLALWAALAGVLSTVVAWRAGLVASPAVLASTVVTVCLYARGAGSPPRRGLVPLVLLVVGGAVLSFLGVVASDAWDASGLLVGSTATSRVGHVSRVVTDPVVLGTYARDLRTSGLGLVGLVGLVAALGRRAAGGPGTQPRRTRWTSASQAVLSTDPPWPSSVATALATRSAVTTAAGDPSSPSRSASTSSAV